MHYAAEQEVELLEERLSSALELAREERDLRKRTEWVTNKDADRLKMCKRS